MSSSDVRLCGACRCHPSPLGFLCDGCSADLRGQLRRLPAAYSELSQRLVKSIGARPCDSVASSGGGSGGSSAPIDLGVSQLISDIDRIIAGLLALVPAIHRPRFRVGIEGRTRVLSAHLGELLLRPEIGQLAADLYWITQRIERMLSPVGERIRLGRCECGSEIYAARSERLRRCRDCRAVHVVADLVAAQETAAEANFADTYVTPAQASKATGGRITLTRITTWINRDKLATTGASSGRRLIRFGDVLELEQAALDRRRKAAS